MTRIRSLLIAGTACALIAGMNAAFADDNRYEARVLVADIPPAPHLDSHLVNGWGVAFNLSPTGFVWVADNGTGFSTLYDGLGNPAPVGNPLIVAIPAVPGNDHGTPTGIVFNNQGGFTVSNGTATGSSAFMFSTEDGLIAGWSPGVDRTHAIRAFPPPGVTPTAVYKGLALATSNGNNFIYATDFVGGKIDVFSSSFAKVSGSDRFAFADPALPKGFSPFNIQNINGHLFVTYAKREDDEDDETAGPSLGAVNEFDTDGNLLRRFARRGRLNAPWGVALAPSNFGPFSNALLIGNFGDGAINAYDFATGEFKGQLKGSNHKALQLDGLWGMAFGNGFNNQPTDTLFFGAGPDDENHGVYGAIRFAPKTDE